MTSEAATPAIYNQAADQGTLEAEDASYKRELKAAGIKMAGALRNKTTSSEELARCKANFDALKQAGLPSTRDPSISATLESIPEEEEDTTAAKEPEESVIERRGRVPTDPEAVDPQVDPLQEVHNHVARTVRVYAHVDPLQKASLPQDLDVELDSAMLCRSQSYRELDDDEEAPLRRSSSAPAKLITAVDWSAAWSIVARG